MAWGKERQAVRRGDDDGDAGNPSLSSLFSHHEAAAIAYFEHSPLSTLKDARIGG